MRDYIPQGKTLSSLKIKTVLVKAGSSQIINSVSIDSQCHYNQTIILRTYWKESHTLVRMLKALKIVDLLKEMSLRDSLHKNSSFNQFSEETKL